MLSPHLVLFCKATVTAVAVTTTLKFFSLLSQQLRFSDEKEDRNDELPRGEDKISELPCDIIHCIFDLMGARDIARVRILSRKWLHIWASYPQLVFDDDYFKEIYKKHKKSIRCEFPKAINHALLDHGRPIFKFVLHIPVILGDLSLKIDKWLLFLSRNEIRELELYFVNPTPYVVPSCLFFCRSLLHLELHNCILKLPHEFEGFHLISLRLVNVSIVASPLTSLIKSASMMKKLTFINCTGIENLSIYVRRLDFFCIINCGEVDWQWFTSIKHLKSMQVILGKEIKNVEQTVILGKEIKNVEQTVNIIKFLKDAPNIKNLCLDGFSLKYLATSYPLLQPHKFPCEDLINSAPLMTKIVIYEFQVWDLDQNSSALCLLKMCPNLMSLEIEIASSRNLDHMEEVTEFLKLSKPVYLRLDKLQTVKIKSLMVRANALPLIKLLLACSSCLQRMVIEHSSGVICPWLSEGISRFRRASISAEIIYIPGN